MHQPGRVRHFQCSAHLGGNRNCFPGGQHPRLVQDQPQGPPRDQFHHDERRPGVHAAVEHGDDARVADRGRVPGLALEPCQERRVDGVLLAEHLDRDLPPEEPVGALPHRGHAARAQRISQLIPAAEYPPAHHVVLLGSGVPGQAARRGYASLVLPGEDIAGNRGKCPPRPDKGQVVLPAAIARPAGPGRRRGIGQREGESPMPGRRRPCAAHSITYLSA